MAAKRVIILEVSDAGNRVKYALWADVPAARQPFYAQPGAKSAWSGASAAEHAAIESGAVVERVEVSGRDGASAAQIKADLQARWQTFQTEITNANPWLYYGTFWDGASWTTGGVA